MAGITNAVAADARAALRRITGMSFFGSPDTKTRVYIALTEHWVACRLPYVVHARSRRTAQHRQQSPLLKALAL